jgi:hypothetical protein
MQTPSSSFQPVKPFGQARDILSGDIEKELLEPGKYEVTPEHTFAVTLYLKSFKGRWIVLDNKAAGCDVHQVVFRMWTFEEMIDMRRRATSIDPSKRVSVDVDMLNRLKIQKLLVSWTFDKDNPRLKAIHVNGILSDDSWRAFIKLSPNIIKRIMDEMNLVLESGG